MARNQYITAMRAKLEIEAFLSEWDKETAIERQLSSKLSRNVAKLRNGITRMTEERA